MNKIMVCVTGQKTCQRLIDFGRSLMKSDEDRMYIIHVAASGSSFLGNSKEAEALEFLYNKAREVGAELTVEKAKDVISKLAAIAKENEINYVVVGESGEADGPDNFLNKFKRALGEGLELAVVPAIS